MAYGSILGQTVDIPDIPTAASQISYNNGSTSSIITSNNVQGAIDQLFTSVSNGKSQIASAITDKGVSTSANASFATMAANIAAISTGIDISNRHFVTTVERSSNVDYYFTPSPVIKTIIAFARRSGGNYYATAAINLADYPWTGTAHSENITDHAEGNSQMYLDWESSTKFAIRAYIPKGDSMSTLCIYYWT